MRVRGCRLAHPWTAVSLALLLCFPAVAENGEAALAAPAEEPAEAAAASWFEDITAAAGVDRAHRTRSFKNPYAHIMEGYTALGASAAVADFDGDGFEDIFFTLSDDGSKNLLYRSNGAGAGAPISFTEVAVEAGVAEGNDAANASANALWFDADNDGDQDLLVLRFGQNLLFLNRGADAEGKVRFDDVTLAAGLGPLYLNCIVAIAFDYDLDSDLDLFLGNYFAPVNLFDPETPRFFPESFETADNGGGMTVFRNDGVGEREAAPEGRKREVAPEGRKRGVAPEGRRWNTPHFTDVTDQVGIRLSGWTLDLGHADADHDGDDDLYVAADFGTDTFLRNNGAGADGTVTFTDVSEEAIGIDTKKGMNVDWGDFDRDGLYDVYVTNITDEYMKEGNFLWQNLGDLKFADVARETGTHATGWGWAGKFFDADNDGWLDLYVVNGWVSQSKNPRDNYVLDIFNLIVNPEIDLADARNWPPMGSKTLSGYQSSSLFHNRGGVFDDIAGRHGVDSIEDGRGIAVADFDHDGRLDLFVTNSGKPPFLWHNVQPTGRHWLQLVLEGRKSNRDAVGARLWLHAGGEVSTSFVNGGNGFASQSSRRVHFGLKDGKVIDKLVVAWPSGEQQTFTGLSVDRIYHLIEGEAKPRPFIVPAAPEARKRSAALEARGHHGRIRPAKEAQ